MSLKSNNLRHLQNSESTSGKTPNLRENLSLNEKELFLKNNVSHSTSKFDENDDKQDCYVSSTEKSVITRAKSTSELPKVQLINQSETESSPSSEIADIITSTRDEESEPYEDSGSEYIPETDVSDSDGVVGSLTSEIENIDQIIVHAENLRTTTQGACNLKTKKTINVSTDYKHKNHSYGKDLISKNPPRKRLWNKKDYCLFCDLEVTKFSRHLLRHHEMEVEVQQILVTKKGSQQRKFLFNKLRNQEHFLKSSTCQNVVPVRKPTLGNPQSPTVATYLPCKYCKGFYKKKYLYRHVKNCPHNDSDKSVKCMAQSEGQSLFATYKQNDILREKIFPIMKADEISFTAKTDPLICNVARRYLKSHREKQSFIVASRKMRQLAALLIELKKKIEIKSLLSALDPLYFDKIVECTKIIAKFDAETETYGAPSLALHMGTELKDCIDVAHNILTIFSYVKKSSCIKIIKF